MNFLEALTANTPISLKPDRPASSHMLSWEQLQLDEATQNIRKQKEQQFIFQTQQLASALRSKEKDSYEQYEKYLQHLLLYQIENDRLRKILSEWDSERSKYTEKCKSVDGAYQHKLQMVKMDLCKSFESKLQEIAQQNNKDLEQIRQIYNRRLSHMTSEAHNLEDVIEKLKIQIQRRNTKIQIVEASNEDALLRLEGKTKQLKDKEIEVNLLKEELKKVKEEELIEKEQRYIEYDRKKGEVTDLIQENEELKDMLQILKGTIEDMREHLSQAQLDKVRAMERKEQVVIQCLALEKEIQQFKSRKTQHHQTQSIKSIPISRQTPIYSRIRSSKPKEEAKEEPKQQQSKELFKDSRSFVKEKEPEKQKVSDSQLISELKNRISELSGKIVSLEEKLKETEGNLIRAEEKVKSQEGYIRSLQEKGKGGEDIVLRERAWGERLNNLQRLLEQMNQEWIKKQRELGNLFKNVENTYLVKLHDQDDILKQTKQALQEKQKQNSELTMALTEKAIQLGNALSKKR